MESEAAGSQPREAHSRSNLVNVFEMNPKMKPITRRVTTKGRMPKSSEVVLDVRLLMSEAVSKGSSPMKPRATAASLARSPFSIASPHRTMQVE